LTIIVGVLIPAAPGHLSNIVFSYFHVFITQYSSEDELLHRLLSLEFPSFQSVFKPSYNILFYPKAHTEQGTTSRMILLLTILSATSVTITVTVTSPDTSGAVHVIREPSPEISPASHDHS
jgi:hypothetical protein